MSDSKKPVWLTLVSWAQKLLVRSKIILTNPMDELGIDNHQAIAYVLKTDSFSDKIALSNVCGKLGLPDPFSPFVVEGMTAPRFVVTEGSKPLVGKREDNENSLESFRKLLALHRQNPELDVKLIPVGLFWGRKPGKSGDNMSSAMIERESPSWLRKFFMLLFLGRRNFIQFSPPVSLRYMADQHGSDEHLAHKLSRVARVHFGRQRRVLTGPDLPRRELIIDALMKSENIQKAIKEEAQSKNISEEKARQKAYACLDEVAAGYSDNLVRVADHILTWLWNKLYRGVNITGAGRVRQLSHDGHEIVYVPCHRSHMDYLLLSYLLYYQGMIPPHIAAGINLNFWPAGPIFRKGGAFFIRRSFAGDKLYTAIFKEYLDTLFSKGYSVEYFCEGGRSRTGRLLAPKTGMIAMTVQSMMRGIERPITFVPVYLGYDHVMEVATYHKELRGKKKEKESVWQVFGAIRKLRNYGQCYVNFGEPITIHQFLNQQVPDWRQQLEKSDEQKPAWLTPVVNKLANQIMRHINDAAAISPAPLTSLALLSTPQNAMERKQLESQLDCYLQLLRIAPYSKTATVPDMDGKQLLQEALDLDKFSVSKDNIGEIVSLSEQTAITMTYYRNNILHMLLIPALIAKTCYRCGPVSRDTLIAKVQMFVPMMRAELFFNTEFADDYINRTIDAMIELDLLHDNEQISENPKALLKLRNIAAVSQESLQRYGILFNILLEKPDIDRASLEKKSQVIAKRLGSLNGITAPEFFDKKLYGNLVIRLKEFGFFDEGSTQVADTAMTINELLSASVKQNIRQSFEQD
ncbi:glycerol-3-phosphate 1-O-acyltransferase PlsB [Paraferrimonas haliotis]|uniref:Glycerol-3-phosphate acyltransferase n=1 Tax=Paraferrimonas haliotis TaxID=2013866 RepID=A0AA37WYV9_9GAMM|nr:glycerol-3-phosphate 1-O-acyltransferase PlsB [Paraferrimonas haliotis]GLS83526.1 glycerol-3-phosphate acyltransferase [Paraferrimonas haliotis]